MPGKDKRPSWLDRWFTWFAVACVAFFVAYQNFEVARAWYRQVRATGFTTADGVVLEHRTEEPDPKTKRLRVVYGFDAGGSRCTGDRVWYDGPRPYYVQDQLVAARFPPGARVTVWYDPADPADAVLLPGLQGPDVLSLWYLLVLDGFVLMYGVGVYRGGTLYGPWTGEYDPARWVRARPWGWRFAPPDPDRWQTVAFDLYVSLAGWYVVSLMALQFLPSVWEAVGMTAGAVATAGLLVYAFQCVEWLEVDAERRELRWHSGRRWAAPFRLPFEAVADVRVGEVTVPDEVTGYRPVVEWYTTRHRTQTISLPVAADRGAVEAFVARLRAAVRGEPAV